MKFLNSVYLKDVSKLGLDTANTIETVNAGEMVWNQADGTLNLGLYNGVTLQQGQEIHVYGKASGAITNGDVVQFAGAQGDHILIKKAVGSEIKINPHFIVGIATQSITNGNFGYITWFGKVHDLDTYTYDAGTILYFDCELDILTNIRPIAPSPTIIMCAVLRKHATEGSILVRPSLQPGINQLSDIHIEDISDNQILVWSDLNSRWENQNLTTEATNVTTIDLGDYYLANEVEGTLQEVGDLLSNALYSVGTDPETGDPIPVDSDTLQGSTWAAVEESILPSTTGLNLGSADHPWNHLYVADSSLYIGDLKLSTDTGALVVANATTGDPVPVATSTLPIATENALGIVKVDGTTITVDEDGVLSGASTYNLPTASTSVLGGVKVDGTKITIDGNGVITTTNAVYNQSLNTTDDVSFDVVTANSYVSTGTGTPTITSSTNIDLTAANAVRITSSPLRLASFTTTNRDLLTPVNGDMIYNSTLGVTQQYEGSAWVTKASTNSPTFTGITTISQQSWQTPTLLNNWVNFGSPFASAAYMKDSMGFVHLKGLVRAGTVGADIMILPSGYQPSEQLIFPIISAELFGRIDIKTNGAVYVNTGNNSWVSLDNIIFKAEQ